MYNQTLYNGLINVIPFWSSNLIQILGLGNEYNIVFNLILTELKIKMPNTPNFDWLISSSNSIKDLSQTIIEYCVFDFLCQSNKLSHIELS